MSLRAYAIAIGDGDSVGPRALLRESRVNRKCWGCHLCTGQWACTATDRVEAAAAQTQRAAAAPENSKTN
eukprot:1988576-Prymnesium_polylepis.1